MDIKRLIDIVEKELDSKKGYLRLRPSWVARDFLKPGRRLGLAENEYNVGLRGFICERWLASETEADNAVKSPNEGLSYLDIDGEELLLRDVIAACGELIMGREYAANHRGLGRLAKIYDFESRIFFHYHQTASDAEETRSQFQGRVVLFPHRSSRREASGNIFRRTSVHRRTA